MRPRILALGVAVFLSHGAPAAEERAAPAGVAARNMSVTAAATGDAARLLDAARGVDPAICLLAAAPIGNGWGNTGAPRVQDETSSLVEWALKPSLDDRDLTVLEEGMRGSDECVRVMAARLLSRSDQGAAILMATLEDERPAVRRASAEGLGHADLEQAAGALRRRLVDDDDAGVRAAAAWALGRIEDPAAEQDLTRALRDASPAVRLAAIDALASLELESSIGVLIPMLGDDDPRIRIATARALGRLD